MKKLTFATIAALICVIMTSCGNTENNTASSGQAQLNGELSLIHI